MDNLKKNEKNNKAIVFPKATEGAKEAILTYNVIKTLDNYLLLEIDLETGRHHQIRAQLSKTGVPIKGDLKYGSPRSNPDGGINLHARKLEFIHPVTKENIEINVRSAYLNVLSLEKQIASQAKALEVAKVNFELNQEKYDAGLISTVDYLDFENTYRQARIKYNKVLLDYYYAFETYRSLLI